MPPALPLMITTDDSAPTLDEILLEVYQLWSYESERRQRSKAFPDFHWTARRCASVSRTFEMAMATLQKSLRSSNILNFPLNNRPKSDRNDGPTRLQWGYARFTGTFPEWEGRCIGIQERTKHLEDINEPKRSLFPPRRAMQSWLCDFLCCPSKQIQDLEAQISGQNVSVVGNVIQSFTISLVASLQNPLETVQTIGSSKIRSLRSLAACAVGKAYALWKEDQEDIVEEDIWYDEIEDIGAKGGLLPDMLRGQFCQAIVTAIHIGWFPLTVGDILVSQCIALGHHTQALEINQALCEVAAPKCSTRGTSGIAPSPLNNIAYLSSAFFTSLLSQVEQKPQIIVEKWFSEIVRHGFEELDRHHCLEELLLRTFELLLGIENAERGVHRRRLLNSKARTSVRAMDSIKREENGWIYAASEDLQHNAAQEALIAVKILCQERLLIDKSDDECRIRSRTLARRVVERMLTWAEVCRPSARHEISGNARTAKFILLCCSLLPGADFDQSNKMLILQEIVRLLLGATIRHAETRAFDDLEAGDEVDIPLIAKSLIGCFRGSLTSSDKVNGLLAQDRLLDLLSFLMDVACGELTDDLETATFGRRLPIATPTRQKLNPVYEKRRKYLLAMFVFHASTELATVLPSQTCINWVKKIERRTVELNLPYTESITADDLKTPKFAVLVQEDETEIIKWRYEEMLESWVAITPTGHEHEKHKMLTKPPLSKFRIKESRRTQKEVKGTLKPHSRSALHGYSHTILSSQKESDQSPLFVRHQHSRIVISEPRLSQYHLKLTQQSHQPVKHVLASNDCSSSDSDTSFSSASWISSSKETHEKLARPRRFTDMESDSLRQRISVSRRSLTITTKPSGDRKTRSAPETKNVKIPASCRVLRKEKKQKCASYYSLPSEVTAQESALSAKSKDANRHDSNQASPQNSIQKLPAETVKANIDPDLSIQDSTRHHLLHVLIINKNPMEGYEEIAFEGKAEQIGDVNSVDHDKKVAKRPEQEFKNELSMTKEVFKRGSRNDQYESTNTEDTPSAGKDYIKATQTKRVSIRCSMPLWEDTQVRERELLTRKSHKIPVKKDPKSHNIYDDGVGIFKTKSLHCSPVELDRFISAPPLNPLPSTIISVETRSSEKEGVPNRMVAPTLTMTRKRDAFATEGRILAISGANVQPKRLRRKS